MGFWDRVIARIKELSTTQYAVAEKMGVRYDMFNRWVHRGILPDAEQAVLLASILDSSVEYLVTGVHPPAAGLPRNVSRVAVLLTELDLSVVELIGVMVQGLVERSREARRPTMLDFAAEGGSDYASDVARAAEGKTPEAALLRKKKAELDA